MRLIARLYNFVIAVWSTKEAESDQTALLGIIADNLSKAGWSWGCVATVDREGRTIFAADAHRGDGPALANSSIWSHGLDRSNLSSERIKLCCEALGSFTEKGSAPLTATSAT
jgi:hypothetical protein